MDAEEVSESEKERTTDEKLGSALHLLTFPSKVKITLNTAILASLFETRKKKKQSTKQARNKTKQNSKD